MPGHNQMNIYYILDEQQPGVEDGGGAHTEVAADQMMDDPVPEGRKTGEEKHGKSTLGAGYPITTPHTLDPLDGKGGEMICICIL